MPATNKNRGIPRLPVVLAISCLIFCAFVASIKVGSYLQSVDQKSKDLSKYQQLYKIMAGYNTPQKSLLLLANNAEIRTGGGFIGTVGLISSNKGKIVPDKLIGIYAIDTGDGCLNKVYQPPTYLLGIGPCTSIRDSSNSLSFPDNAKEAMYYYQQYTSVPVNNVVQFTPEVIVALLDKLGPVNLKDYNITVTKDNFRDNVQLEVETGRDKVLGKDPKSGILGELSNQLIARLLSKNIIELKSYSTLFQQLIDQKQIVIYSSNTQVEDIIKSIGAAGEVKQTDDNYFMMADANIAANKSSPYIKNSVVMNQFIETDGSSTIDLKIISRHTSGYRISYIDPNIPTEKRWLIGDDHSYVSMALPKDAKLLNSSIGIGNISQHQELDKLVLGYYRNITPLSESTVTLRYKLPTKYLFGDKLAINTFIQKQIGGWPYDLSYTLTLPNGGYQLDASNVTPLDRQILGKDTILTYNGNVNSDQVLSFIYAKK